MTARKHQVSGRGVAAHLVAVTESHRRAHDAARRSMAEADARRPVEPGPDTEGGDHGPVPGHQP